MKVCMHWLIFCVVVGSVQSIRGASKLDEYSPENIRTLTTWAYVVGGTAAAFYIASQLMRKNRLQRAAHHIKQLNFKPVKTMLMEFVSVGPMLRYALVHTIIKTL